MWWAELEGLGPALAQLAPWVDPTAQVHPRAALDMHAGPISIGARSRIGPGARIEGPVEIGADCMIGDLALLRGPLRIGDGSRVGFATELKNACIGRFVSIGPQCFVADSIVDDDAYLGAQVRTSNHRLDGRNVSVDWLGERRDSGRDKLGCWIGTHAALGIQVIVLPGRIIAADSLIGPRITVERNLPSGRYRLTQTIAAY